MSHCHTLSHDALLLLPFCSMRHPCTLTANPLYGSSPEWGSVPHKCEPRTEEGRFQLARTKKESDGFNKNFLRAYYTDMLTTLHMLRGRGKGYM